MPAFVSSSPPVLVLGATGTVGRPVVTALLARGASVTALVRSAASARTLPAGVHAVEGDLGDAAIVQREVDRAGVVFLVNPHDPDEERYVENVVRACERAQVRLVYLGVHVHARWRWLRALLRATLGLLLFPHYARRFRAGERVLRARTKTQLVIASAFFQNDALFHQDILEGRYTQPLGARGVTQVDVRDIADAAATILLDPDLPRGCFCVTGPEAMSGPRAAAIWASALDRPVVYAGDDRSAWMRAIERHLDGHKREDFLKTYRSLALVSSKPSPAALAQTTALLGRPPRSYGEYVEDVVATMARERSVASARAAA